LTAVKRYLAAGAGPRAAAGASGQSAAAIRTAARLA